jgi:protocatechuate 3,4-dioxygenase beta subunit
MRLLGSWLCAAGLATSALAAEIPVSGRVLDLSGQPIAGVVVELRPVASPARIARHALASATLAAPASQAETAADGSYRLVAPQAGIWVVQAQASGFVAMTSQPLSVLDETVLSDLELPRAEELVVAIKAASGAPIAGALVRAERPQPRGPRAMLSSDWVPQPRMVRSDAEGNARLARADNEKLRLSIAAPGFAVHQLPATGSKKLQATLQAGLERTVDVRGADGKPVAGAVVALGEPHVPVGLTAADGTLRVRLPADESIELRVAMDDGRRGEQQVAAPKTDAASPPIRFDLGPLSRVTGRVIDIQTRRPIAGALVGPLQQVWQCVTTGGAGQFSFEWFAEAGRGPEIGVTANGYLDGRQQLAKGESRTDLTIALRPAAAIAGTVVDERGTPIAGAELALTVQPQGGMRMVRRLSTVRSLLNSSRTRSTLRGTFRLTGLDPEQSYQLSVKHPGFGPVKTELVGLEPRKTKTGVTIKLQAGLSIVGTVVDAQGVPLPGAQVSARPAPADRQGRVMVVIGGASEGKIPEIVAHTDANGRFELVDLAAGRYDLSAKRKGFARNELPGISLEQAAGQYEAGTMRLEPGQALQGMVVDPSGAPLDEAQVRIVPKDPMAAMMMRLSSGQPPEAVSRPDGWFVLEDRVEGEILDIAVGREGYVDVIKRGLTVPVTEPLTIELTAASTIRGKVLDLDGRPIVGASVGMQRTRGEGRGGRSFAFSMVIDTDTDQNGEFEFENVEPGTIALTAKSTGMQPQEMPSIAVTAGKDLTDLVFTLEPGATIEGRVTTPDGQPVVGASVGPVEESSEPGRGRFAGGAETDGDGRYRLDSLLPGSTSIEATHDHYPRAVRSIELKPGVNRLDVVLSGGFDVEGRVVDSSGKALVGARVRLGQGERFFGGPEAQSGVDGSFRFAGVASGEYRLDADRDGYAPLEQAVTVRVDKSNVTGVEVRLQIGGAIFGSLQGLDPKLMSETEVNTSIRFSGVRPDFKGNYRIENLAPGEYTIEARVGSTGRRASGTVTLPEGALEARLDLQFGAGLTVRGSAMQGDTPADGAVVSVIHLEKDASGWSRTDHQGAFAIEGLDPGKYRLILSWNGTQHEETLELSSDRELTIEIPAAELIGTVVDVQTKEPVAGASVTLERQNESRQSPRFPFGSGATTDTAGGFTLGNIADDTWRLIIKAPGYAALEQLLTVQGGRVQGSDMKFALTPTEGMTLDVRNAAGGFPDEVRVAVLDPAGRVLVSGSYPTLENGRVRISTVPPGSWTLLISAGSSATASLQVTTPGPAVGVTLSPGCALQVRIKALESTPGSTASIKLTSADGRTARTLRLFGSIQESWRAVSGRALIEGLPPGLWRVRAEASDGTGWQGEVTTSAGAPAEIQL